MADNVNSTFENIASEIKLGGKDIETGEFETKIRNFLKSNAVTMLYPIRIEQINIEENIREFSETSEEFQALVASIRKAGVIQPPVVTVREIGAKLDYVCVTGHRRIAAAKEAGLEKLTCIFKKFSDNHLKMISTIVENTHRKNLHPFELADAIRRLTQNGYSFVELENIFDKNQWNLRRFNKMNDWTSLSKKLVKEHSEKFTPTFLLHLSARALEAQEVENEIKKKLGLIENGQKSRKLLLLGRFEEYASKESLSDEQRNLIKNAFLALGLLKAPKNSIDHN